MEEKREAQAQERGVQPEPMQVPATGQPHRAANRRWGGFLCGFAAAAVLTGALLLAGVLRIGASEPHSALAAAPAVSTSDTDEEIPAETIGEADAQQESGFATPEAAVEAYLNGMKQADVSAMLNAFAVEKYVEQFNMKKFLEKIGAYNINMQPRFPTTSEFTRVLNVEQRRGELTRQIGYQYLALTHPEEDLSMGPVLLKTQEEIDALLNVLGDTRNVEILQSVELVGFENPVYLHEMYAMPQLRKSLSEKAEYLGCETMGSMAARAKVNGVEYLFCFDAASYDGRWYLTDFSGYIGTLLGINPQFGGVIPLSVLEEEW